MVPGAAKEIPSEVRALLTDFPQRSDSSLSKADLLLHFRLVGLGSIALLQNPVASSFTSEAPKSPDLPPRGNSVDTDATPAADTGGQAVESREQSAPLLQRVQQAQESSTEIPFSLDVFPGKAAESVCPELRLSALLEGIRQGRIIQANAIQAIAAMCVCSLSLGLWPLVANAIPLSCPPSLPPPIALLFVFVYVPAIVIAILLGPAAATTMKNTPRKNIFTTRDEKRFVGYLACRCGFVAASTFFVGWLAVASTSASVNDERHGMISFHHVDFADAKSVSAFWLVQDVMSSQVLMSILAQASTMLERGQRRIKRHPLFLGTALSVLLLHACIMAARASMRVGGLDGYRNLNWAVWTAQFGLPILSACVGVAVNADDNKSYKRHMQFLRLEFETKLGMHSPR